MKIKGWLDIYLRDELGYLKEERHLHNVITHDGNEHVADQMSDQGQATMGYMAVGTGTEAATSADTALQAEISRVPLTSKTQQPSPNENQVKYVADWGAGTATGAITEAGIFNADSGGVMMCRQVFAEINKGTADTLTINWTLTFGS